MTYLWPLLTKAPLEILSIKVWANWKFFAPGYPLTTNP